MNGGRIPWNATATCETFKISLMRRHPMWGGSEYHLTDRLFPQWTSTRGKGGAGGQQGSTSIKSWVPGTWGVARCTWTGWSWDHYPVAVRIEGRELREVKGRTGWAGWLPNEEDERRKFRSRVLYSGGVPVPGWWGRMSGKSLQNRLEVAVTPVKRLRRQWGTRANSRFWDGLREMAEAAATRNDGRGVLWKRTRRATEGVWC